MMNLVNLKLVDCDGVVKQATTDGLTRINGLYVDAGGEPSPTEICELTRVQLGMDTRMFATRVLRVKEQMYHEAVVNYANGGEEQITEELVSTIVANLKSLFSNPVNCIYVDAVGYGTPAAKAVHDALVADAEEGEARNALVFRGCRVLSEAIFNQVTFDVLDDRLPRRVYERMVNFANLEEALDDRVKLRLSIDSQPQQQPQLDFGDFSYQSTFMTILNGTIASRDKLNRAARDFKTFCEQPDVIYALLKRLPTPGSFINEIPLCKVGRGVFIDIDDNCPAICELQFASGKVDDLNDVTPSVDENSLESLRLRLFTDDGEPVDWQNTTDELLTNEASTDQLQPSVVDLLTATSSSTDTVVLQTDDTAVVANDEPVNHVAGAESDAVDVNPLMEIFFADAQEKLSTKQSLSTSSLIVTRDEPLADLLYELDVIDGTLLVNDDVDQPVVNSLVANKLQAAVSNDQLKNFVAGFERYVDREQALFYNRLLLRTIFVNEQASAFAASVLTGHLPTQLQCLAMTYGVLRYYADARDDGKQLLAPSVLLENVLAVLSAMVNDAEDFDLDNVKLGVWHDADRPLSQVQPKRRRRTKAGASFHRVEAQQLAEDPDEFFTTLSVDDLLASGVVPKPFDNERGRKVFAALTADEQRVISSTGALDVLETLSNMSFDKVASIVSVVTVNKVKV